MCAHQPDTRYAEMFYFFDSLSVIPVDHEINWVYKFGIFKTKNKAMEICESCQGTNTNM